MADDAAVIVGIGAIVAVGVGIWIISRQRAMAGGGGGIFGDGGGGGGGTGGPMAINQNCTFYPSSGNYCWSSKCTTAGSTQVACAKGSCSAARSAFIAGCASQGGGGGGGTTAPNCGDCNHLNCAGVQACLSKCPPFSSAVLNRCGIPNISGNPITPGTPLTGGRPTQGGTTSQFLPCICDQATRRSKCPNLCSCTACWKYYGTNTPCNPTGAELQGDDNVRACEGLPPLLSFVHRPDYNRTFYNPTDEMRLVISS